LSSFPFFLERNKNQIENLLLFLTLQTTFNSAAEIMNLDTANQVEYDLYLQGLTEETVKKISADLQEPERMLELRLKSLEIFHKLPMPSF
jgi:hypothetical protein